MGPNQRVEGQVPEDWRPGTGTIITGEAADEGKAVALVKYPDKRGTAGKKCLSHGLSIGKLRPKPASAR